MAANGVRGEVAITVAGRERVMKLGANELCAVETVYPDRSFFKLIDTLTDPDTLRFEVVRTLLRASLMRSLPDLDDAAAGDLIDELGMALVVQKLMECAQAAFPGEDEVDAAGPKPKAAAGPVA